MSNFLKKKKFALAKLLASKIILPSTIDSLKFPINNEGKIPVSRTSFEFVKTFVHEQKTNNSVKIKLYRNNKK